MDYSRRKFLSKVGLASSLLTVPSLVSLADRIPYQGKKLGVALVGLGSYATYQLTPALKQASNCYLAGIVTGTPEKAEKWKKEHSIPDANVYNYENFDQIADN